MEGLANLAISPLRRAQVVPELPLNFSHSAQTALPHSGITV
jgi:hypothetical protein